MNVPDWANELAKQVCGDYRRTPPEINWRQSHDRSYKYWGRVENASTQADSSGATPLRSYAAVEHKVPANKYSSGSASRYRNHITVTAGSDETDQKLVLLHELAHHIVHRTKKGKRQGHSLRFWRLAFELYNRYGLDLQRAYEREKSYKVKATQAYTELATKLNATN